MSTRMCLDRQAPPWSILHCTAVRRRVPVDIPDRLTQEPLHPVRRAVSGLLGQLPTQSVCPHRTLLEQERPRPAPRHPAEPTGHPREAHLEPLHPILGRYAVTSGHHKIFSYLHKSLMITWARPHARGRAHPQRPHSSPIIEITIPGRTTSTYDSSLFRSSSTSAISRVVCR
jgi:hypothetical protein